MADINLINIIGLAAVDAVNPCAIAVMAMVLMSILLQNPTKRKNVLLGGLAFTLAVFILYFLYGLIMVQFFSHLIPATGYFSMYVFKGFGILAIILGLLNLKDFLRYKPGSLGTEMPMTLRPRVKMLIKKITSPKGAFVIGLIVTLFLLPCTIGPYIIASGKLSVLSFLASIPWLLI
ncbi:MAG TPA: sulfite exporter TauE/SafE family protein, partial [Candidatus Paceibacterota bacterium]|nr:sulfite exporter TauE/SafE family protein [Candidatus Paceibacterota bacterium]